LHIPTRQADRQFCAPRGALPAAFARLLLIADDAAWGKITVGIQNTQIAVKKEVVHAVSNAQKAVEKAGNPGSQAEEPAAKITDAPEGAGGQAGDAVQKAVADVLAEPAPMSVAVLKNFKGSHGCHPQAPQRRREGLWIRDFIWAPTVRTPFHPLLGEAKNHGGLT